MTDNSPHLVIHISCSLHGPYIVQVKFPHDNDNGLKFKRWRTTENFIGYSFFTLCTES